MAGRDQLAVNVSPPQFNDPGTVSRDSTLSRVRAAGGRLDWRSRKGFLAESDSTDTFAKLKTLGVRISMDDFGTGYARLGYLRKLPFDKIKIDQASSAAQPSTTQPHAAILRAIVTLADTLDMDTCAEGVKAHDDLRLIRQSLVSAWSRVHSGRLCPEETARELPNRSPSGRLPCIREPRHRLNRRAVTGIDGEMIELHLRNISSMGALVEYAAGCSRCGTRHRYRRRRPCPQDRKMGAVRGRSAVHQRV